MNPVTDKRSGQEIGELIIKVRSTWGGSAHPLSKVVDLILDGKVHNGVEIERSLGPKS